MSSMYDAPANEECLNLLENDELIIEKHYAVGSSPMLFPQVCVKCGAVDGTLRTYKERIAFRRTLRMTKHLRVHYMLCIKCRWNFQRRFLLKTSSSVLIALLFIAPEFFDIRTHYYAVVILCFLVVALILNYFWVPQLKVIKYKKGVFTLIGYSAEFYASLQRLKEKSAIKKGI